MCFLCANSVNKLTFEDTKVITSSLLFGVLNLQSSGGDLAKQLQEWMAKKQADEDAAKKRQEEEIIHKTYGNV